MTTITYRDGVIASDSLGCRGGTKEPYTDKKLFRHNGSVLAVVGEYANAVSFANWIMSGKKGDRPRLGGDSAVIEFKPEGVVVYELEGSFPINTEFAAWGSGAMAALAALHMGASAKQAVKVAKKVDVYTGGKVKTMKIRLEQKP